MMPEFASRALRQIPLLVLLLCAIALLLLFAARDVLTPLWPPRIAESVYAADRGNATEAVFHRAGRLPSIDGRLLARSRPLSLVAVERPGGEIDYGYLLGWREQADAPLALLPEVDRLLAQSPPAAGVVVLDGGRRGHIALAAGEIDRWYRPNRLDLSGRVTLGWWRVVEAWRRAG